MDNILEEFKIDRSIVDLMVAKFGKKQAIDEITSMVRIWIAGIVNGNTDDSEMDFFFQETLEHMIDGLSPEEIDNILNAETVGEN